MASVIGGDLKAYNAGTNLDLNILSGGSQSESTSTLGARIYGDAGNQQVDPTLGGNAILMHQQSGGSRSKSKRKTPKRKTLKSKSKMNKRKTVGGKKNRKTKKSTRKH